MSFSYQFIDYEFGLPVKIFINTMNTNKPHFHKDLELIWVLGGRVPMLVGGDEYTLKENDLILVNSYSIHNVLAYQYGTTFISMQIDKHFCSSLIKDFDDKDFELKSFSTPKESQEQYDLVRHLFSKIVRSYNKKVADFHQEISRDLAELVSLIDTEFSAPANSRSRATQKERNWIKVIEYIERHYREEISMRQVAQKAHYNYSYFSEAFRKNVGLSFTDYLDRSRLQNAMPLLLYSDKNVAEIAFEVGFSNVKSFYRAFKKYYDSTPLEYKNNLGTALTTLHPHRQEQRFINIQEKLNKYLSRPGYAAAEEVVTKRKLLVDVTTDKGRLHKVWQRMINVGSAFTILDYNLQEQIKEVQKEIGFEYLRFEGIFNDEFQIVREHEDGTFQYNWKRVDQVLDFILKIEMKPFICLGFMPAAFARTKKRAFYYKAHASPPNNIEKWLDLVENFAVHCINRYGLGEVESWYFQVWHEYSIFGVHWDGTDEEYHEFYKATAERIKKISPRLQVGPAAENYYTGYRKTEKILTFCRLNNVPMDFYAAAVYHNRVSNMNSLNFSKDEFFDEQLLSDINFSYYDKMHTLNTIRRTCQLIDINYQTPLPLMVVRWNISWDVQEYVHDTAFMAPAIMDNVLKARDYVDGMGFLSLSDILTEWPVDSRTFYGGSGLINTDGIKKPAYYGFLFLSKLGDFLVDQGDFYIVTRSRDEIQIILYNYAYFDQFYMSGNRTAVSELTRYDAFQEQSTLDVELILRGLSGKYKLTHYTLGKDNGSAFDEWVALGAPEEMTAEEINYIKRKAFPQMTIAHHECNEMLRIKTEIPIHGAKLILIRKLHG